jgi:hypothetical protein
MGGGKLCNFRTGSKNRWLRLWLHIQTILNKFATSLNSPAQSVSNKLHCCPAAQNIISKFT